MPSVVTAVIEKLVYGGDGLARTNGRVVLVPDTVPGETIEIEITGERAHTLSGKIHAILEPAQARRTPPCPYAGTCGGCNWQHIEYDMQVEWKKRIFIESCVRIGKLTDVPEPEMFLSPQWAYRCRAQFQTDTRQSRMGFFSRNTNDVIDVDTCMLLTPALNCLLVSRREILSGMRPDCSQLRAVAGTAGNRALCPVIAPWGTEEIDFTAGTAVFHVRAEDFFQSNIHCVRSLAEWPLAHAGGRVFFDLYGGVGLFSVFLAQKFSEGFLVESDSAMAQRAQKNFAANNIASVRAIADKAERFLLSEKARALRPDCIIVDPPRTGCTREVVQALGSLKPQRIVYISCNPSTLARDMGTLCMRHGYTVAKAAVFDMYPQTHHIESAVVLEPR